jgi:hypothetical protein
MGRNSKVDRGFSALGLGFSLPGLPCTVYEPAARAGLVTKKPCHDGMLCDWEIADDAAQPGPDHRKHSHQPQPYVHPMLHCNLYRMIQQPKCWTGVS